MKTRQEIIIERLLYGLFLAVVAWFVLPDRWTDRTKYVMEYGIGGNQVHWNPKPTDCDFMYAPLGVMGCHYKKIVTAFNAAGEVVTGENPPSPPAASEGHRYAKNVYGDTIVSYDGGKTWKVSELNPAPRDWLGETNPNARSTPTPDIRVKSLEISWNKITE